MTKEKNIRLGVYKYLIREVALDACEGANYRSISEELEILKKIKIKIAFYTIPLIFVNQIPKPAKYHIS